MVNYLLVGYKSVSNTYSWIHNHKYTCPQVYLKVTGYNFNFTHAIINLYTKHWAVSAEILASVFVELKHSLHEDPNSLAHAEVNHARRSYVYTMGILYRKISTWRTKQLVNSRRRYVSTKPVRRFLSQELVEITIF